MKDIRRSYARLPFIVCLMCSSCLVLIAASWLFAWLHDIPWVVCAALYVLLLLLAILLAALLLSSRFRLLRQREPVYQSADVVARREEGERC